MTSKKTSPAAASLREALGDRVVLAGEPDYDAARTPWNLAIDQRPIAVVHPESPQEVADAVRAAAAAGLRVAPQATGHGAGALSDTDLSDVVLMTLGALRGAEVDAEAATARVLGGSQWNDVLEAAAPHGLTALHGSSGDVGVVGYTLSGGMSFYARTHGLAVNAVRAVEVVTADGALVRATAEDNADLFWALRGGSGAFGVVTAIEIDLLPYADVYAGMLLWDASHAADVAHAWAEWTTTAPESCSTSLRVMHLPPLPELPPFLSGRDLVVVDGAILETDETAAEILAPLRALEPEMDTFARMPAAELVAVHMDPPEPSPALSAGAMLSHLSRDAVDTLLKASAAPGLFFAELRHVGGAAARSPEGAGAVGAVAGDYMAAGIAIVPDPAMAEMAHAAVHGVVNAMRPWHAASLALTFLDGGVDRSLGFGQSLARLRALKAEYDPGDVFAAGQPV